jgi:signal transduction histidine kinase
MIKTKLLFFGLLTCIALTIALVAAALTAQLTRQNLSQSTMAQSLLIEHQNLSSISYRLFKQLTDELIFGQNANQADVRNKQQQIAESLDTIRILELQQRSALGAEVTQGSVEDTNDLATLLQSIVEEFQSIVASADSTPLSTQSRLQRLLEVTIDNQFRESINSAVNRQSNVVSAINSRIDTLNTAIVWFTAALGLLSIPLIIIGCVWLFNQLYQPLHAIKAGTDAIAAGNYEYRLPASLDREFRNIVEAFNTMAKRLAEHESQAEQSRRQLEFEVEKRTREITDANQRLTAIDHKRRQFLADLSHELRTPLTVIRGEAQVTLRQPEQDAQVYRQTLETILSQAIGVSRLVDDLLLLARAEISQLVLDLDHCNIGSWFSAQQNHWQRFSRKHTIQWSIEPSAQHSVIRADQQRLSQVLAILIDNACKYSPAGSNIRVSASDDASGVTLRVQDEGEGIAPSNVGHIFERFVRISRKGGGAGLGLAIAKTIVDAHGGDIHVDSVQQQGSTFIIWLPRELIS